jgi:CRP/FNR family transcriptional regulator
MSKIEQKTTAFFANFPEKKIKKGETIIQPEEPLIFIYYLVSGYVKSFSLNDEGMELTINIFKPNSYFPITETLTGRTNPYFFEAITDVVLRKAPTHKVHEFVKDDHEVLFDLTKRISSGLEGFMIRTQYLIRSNAKQKISSSLLLLARRFGQNTPNKKVKILLPQTHEDIANLAGVSRETASLELKKLENEKIISSSKQIYIINDFKKLREISTIYFEDQTQPHNFQTF